MPDEPVVDFGARKTPGGAPLPPGPPAPPSPAVSPAFRTRADRWKRELLDVTRRNRGINYRPTKGSLQLPATPAELWDILIAAEGSTAFDVRSFAPDAPIPAEDERAKEALAATARLVERARLADREQGIHVLFVALGWLNWVDTDKKPMRSPLVLVPVDLAHDRQAQRLTIEAASGDEPEVNPSLAYLLHAQGGLRLPRLEDEEGAPLHESLAAFLAAARDVVAKQAGWSVEEGEPMLDVFAFAKLAMVDEIDHSLERLAAHPVLRAIAGDLGAVEPPVPQEGALDARYPAGSLRTVVESDAYQLQAVGMAAEGGSFVIEGPPGTGKSQTITNIIAELLGQGKTVLFVAEKRVAREVVLENLTKAGLAEACLHLAANASAAGKADTKARVIQEIVDVGNGVAPIPPADAQLPPRANELRERLNAYAAAIGAPVGDGGWTTPYEVFARASELRAAARPGLPIPPLPGLTRFWLEDVLEEAKVLDKMTPAELAVMAGPWANLTWSSVDAAAAGRLRAALEQLAGVSGAFEATASPALGDTHPPATAHTLADLDALAGRLEAVANYRRRAKSLLRFVQPAYYSARTAYREYLSAGYRETNTEGEAATSLRTQLAVTRESLGVAGEALGASVPTSGAVADLGAWASGLLATFESLPVAAEIVATLVRVEPSGMRPAFAALLADASTHGRMEDTVRASVYGAWAAQLAVGPLTTTPDQYARTVATFGRVEGEMIGWSRAAALGPIRAKRSRLRPSDPATAQLVKYARAKRRPSLRTMLGNTREAIQVIKPCLLMSPLAAAQYLCQEGAGYRFDACIVDEASMIPTPDMVVALSLATQAIITGDSKQMPPTNFFHKEIEPTDGDDEPDVTFESVLDECAPIVPSTMLRAHYRSRDESLIAFSNVHFYDGKLIAFPDAWEDRPESGVRFEYVGDAVYGRGESRANPAEARRAIELLRAELANDAGKHVAITAMSLAQQQEIVGQLEPAALLDPLLRAWIDAGGQVRNLETVQGDECDIMILSIGYGKDADGRLLMNFGPLGQEKGERRLNVAVTRAKWKTVVVTSIRGGDIDPARTSSTGALRLRDYLNYAEHGPSTLAAAVASSAVSAAGEPTTFERIVLAALEEAGLRCVPRVGVGGYRVDIGVLHQDDPNRFVLGIECDGPSYSAAPAAKDRDISRTGALERAGWTMERAWSAAWWRSPEGELERLLTSYRAAIAPQS